MDVGYDCAAPYILAPTSTTFMANIATLLKKEIQRQTDKAVKQGLRSLTKQLREEQRRVADLERQVSRLSKSVAKGISTGSTSGVATASQQQWSSSKVTKLRKQHKLSQNALAKLLGVGLNTVWLWEQGRTSPRAKQQNGIIELTGLSSLQMRRRLTKVGLSEGRSKPGRKPGSKNKPKTVAKKTTRKVAKKTTRKVTKKK